MVNRQPNAIQNSLLCDLSRQKLLHDWVKVKKKGGNLSLKCFVLGISGCGDVTCDEASKQIVVFASGSH